MLSGCTESSPEDRLNNYLERLSRALNLEGDELSKNAMTEPPRYQWGYTGTLKQTLSTSQSTISILDFLSLYGCDLQVVIAERNSSLGKFAPTSQTLIQHLRFLHLAPACIQQLLNEQNLELAKQLQQDQQHKQKHLPLLIWKALLNEQEAKLFWKTPNTLDHYPEQVSIAPELALKRLNYLSQQWMSGHYDTGLNELEPLLADLRSGDGGSLLLSFNLLSNKLSLANRKIALYLQKEACFNKRPSIRVNILENVVETFFIGDVQQWSAKLNRRYYALIEAYQALEQTFVTVEPDLYAQWRETRDQQLKAGLTSSARHVRHIKQALNVCSPQEDKTNED